MAPVGGGSDDQDSYEDSPAGSTGTQRTCPSFPEDIYELFGGTIPGDTYRISEDHVGDSEGTYGDSEGTYGLTASIVGVVLELYSC